MNNASYPSRLHPPTGPPPNNASICPASTSTSSSLCLNSFSLSYLPAFMHILLLSLLFSALWITSSSCIHCPSMFLLLVSFQSFGHWYNHLLWLSQPVLPSRVLPVKDNRYVHMLDCSVQI